VVQRRHGDLEEIANVDIVLGDQNPHRVLRT
jgi:hypothetical protein